MAWSAHQDRIYNFAVNGVGHLVVLARAGSGKTTTIKEVCRRMPRARILVCAFDTRIRDELVERLRQLRHVQVKGLNQLGFGTLMRYRGQTLSVDRYRLRDFMRRLVPEGHKSERGDVFRLLSMCMANLAIAPEHIQEMMYAYDLRPADPALDERYVSWVQSALAFIEAPSPTVSFDEQVYLPAKLNLTTGSYDVVIVDEMQDLTPAQYRLVVNAVKPRTGRVFAFGDDRQNIYGFRGADVSSSEKFCHDLSATVLPLPVTYRNPRLIVELAKHIVQDFEAAPDAPDGLLDSVTEREFLASVREGDAVISRSNAALSKYCMLLLGAGRRARIIGRDLGTKLTGLLARSRSEKVPEVLEELGRFVESETERLVAARKDDMAEELVDNLEALRAISEGVTSLSALTVKVEALFSDERDATDGVIAFMTVHKAKGREFDRVWMFESTFRLNSIEGENLYYVAITRAKKELILVQLPRSDGKYPKSIKTQLEEEEEGR